jgi:hypothetical protein
MSLAVQRGTAGSYAFSTQWGPVPGLSYRGTSLTVDVARHP